MEELRSAVHDHRRAGQSTIEVVVASGLTCHAGALGATYDSAAARFIEFISGAHRGRVLRTRITGLQQAVRVHGSTDVVVSDNELGNVGGWGISIQTGAHRAEVARNRITGTVNEHGIYASASPGDRIRGLVVRDNAVSGSKIDGIKLTYTEDAVVEGNRIRRQRVGVHVAGGRDTAVGLNSCDECQTAVVVSSEGVVP